jgi:hypothetical protein
MFGLKTELETDAVCRVTSVSSKGRLGANRRKVAGVQEIRWDELLQKLFTATLPIQRNRTWTQAIDTGFTERSSLGTCLLPLICP